MAVDTRTVIRDVSASLKALLKANVSELYDDSYISYDSPGDISASTTKLSMYLYHITENPCMRNSERVPVTNTNQFKYPPSNLDLYYLMTPFGGNNREMELLLLGRIFQLFHEHPVLSGTELLGNLTACGNQQIRVSYNNLAIQDIKMLWETFPGKNSKLCLSYLVSPILLPAERSITIPRVQTKDLRLDQK